MRRHGEELSEEGQDYARRMVDSARRLQEMINDLLDYSRVNTRGHVFEEVPLDQVVDGVITDLELRLRESGGTIERGPLPTIQADPLQMRQLFTNLLSNALKFRRPDAAPRVQVRAAPPPADDPERVAITVEDNGIGFDEKYLDRMFQPFQRLHSRQEYDGSGIGLAICRRIVERHGGALQASSRPGKGSIFTVILPLRPPPPGYSENEQGFP